METNKPENAYDAVKMMREIRNKISQETQSMIFEQLKAYIKSRLAEGNSRLIGQ